MIPGHILIQREQFDCILIQAGQRGCLTASHARVTGLATQLALRRHPSARIDWWVAGYDTDPRELWDIPQVAAHIRSCAEAAGFTDGYSLPRDQVTGEMVLLLVKCGVFGDNHPFEIRMTA